MSDLRDDILAAASESATQEPASQEVETSTPSDDRPRDQSGKFVSKDTNAVVSEEVRAADKLVEKDAPTDETAKKTETEVPEEESTWKEDRAPSSWKPAIRERWGEIPPEIRAEIVRREEAAVMGARRLNEQLAPAQEFVQSLNPYIQEARQFGVNPTQHIASVMHTERVLRTADLPTKFQALMGIADQYGIPLRDVINKSVGEEVIKSPRPSQTQIPQELQQELQELKAWRESQERVGVRSEIENFGKTHEFFDDVRNHMATLISSGAARGLEDAYEQAIWMVPDVREVLLRRQTTTNSRTEVANRQTQAARVGSVTNNTSPTATPSEEESDDIHSVIRRAVRDKSGRV